MEELIVEHPLCFVSGENEPICLFGIECGKGWKNIIKSLLVMFEYDYKYSLSRLRHLKEGSDEYIKIHNETLEFYNNIPKICQIKQKFGALTIYTDYPLSDTNRKLLTMAEELSVSTCENCGDMNGEINKLGYRMCLCDDCRNNKR